MTYFTFREGSHSSVSLIWRSFSRKNVTLSQLPEKGSTNRKQLSSERCNPSYARDCCLYWPGDKHHPDRMKANMISQRNVSNASPSKEDIKALAWWTRANCQYKMWKSDKYDWSLDRGLVSRQLRNVIAEQLLTHLKTEGESCTN